MLVPTPCCRHVADHSPPDAVPILTRSRLFVAAPLRAARGKRDRLVTFYFAAAIVTQARFDSRRTIVTCPRTKIAERA